MVECLGSEAVYVDAPQERFCWRWYSLPLNCYGYSCYEKRSNAPVMTSVRGRVLVN